MKIDPSAPIVTLEVELIGKRGRYLVSAAFDTGSTYTIIPWTVAENLGYNPAASKERVPITTASGTETIPLITIEGIEALEMKREYVKVGCHDLPPQSMVNALLGLSFIRGFKIELDLKEGALAIEDP